ncbi:disease resistance protein UNI [Medicago truncatula]|uniref:disease resistance protein UNI n=1 Tax=Medicago truncatula TaxID=3880 RepID=UPI000D2F4812|nr:disease resistance protein UNI [Medicago truncatula]
MATASLPQPSNPELSNELADSCCLSDHKKELGWKTVKQSVDLATRGGENVHGSALFLEEEADKLILDDTKTNQKCFFGFCPHCIWRYKRGKELANKKEHIKKLLETGKELAIGLPAYLLDVERYSSQHYISFKSRESKYIELLNVLKDDNNYIIGLQGMGGTRKTTMVKEVGKKLKQSNQFTQIIDTTMSFSPDIKKIQDDVAGPLGLKFDDCNDSDRPKKLWSRLTNGKKILLILDDVWGDIDFNELGIPYSGNHKGCKILVTACNLLVCNRLGRSKTIQLDLLSEEDTWIMFQRHAGLSKTSTKNLLEKGRKIAYECKMLTIAIAVIASSLKGEQRREEWDVALNSLQKHMSMHGVDDELLKIYKCLQVSYDNMKNEKAKRLFLWCSVFQVQ